jgi:NitT/TauT family transport system substrate-binding protein
MKKHLFLIILIAALITTTIFFNRHIGYSIYEKGGLVMATSPYPTSRFFYLAEAKGFFEEEGLNIKLVETPDEESVQTMAGGRVDFIHLTADWYVIAKASGLEAKQIFFVDRSLEADGIAVNENVNSMKELKGKKTALLEGTISHFILLEALEQANMTSKDIVVVSMPADKAIIAFLSGDVDAAVSWEPWLSQIKERKGAKILIKDKDLPYWSVSSIVASDQVIKENPEEIKKLMGAYFRAVEYWKNNPEESNEIMSKSLGISKEEFKFLISKVDILDYDENIKITQGEENSLVYKLLKKANEYWINEGIIKEPVSPNESLALDFLRELNFNQNGSSN